MCTIFFRVQFLFYFFSGGKCAYKRISTDKLDEESATAAVDRERGEKKELFYVFDASSQICANLTHIWK